MNCEGVRPPGVAPLPADKGGDHCEPGELEVELERVSTLDNPVLPGGSSPSSNMNQHWATERLRG